MPNADLLIEFMSEELPPHNLESFAISFATYIDDKLNKFKDIKSQTKYFVSPRRFACYITHIMNKEPSKLITRKGPAINNSLKDGNATGALLGFAKSCGVEWNLLEQNTDGYFYYSYTSDGNSLEYVLPNIINDGLKQLPVAKMMRWGNFDYQFVRPLHNLLLTYDNKVICSNINIMGLSPTNSTYGHRVMSNGSIAINEASEYENILKNTGFVVADFTKRKELILQQLMDISNRLSLKISPVGELLDEVTALVEYPVTLVGEFDIDFLKVPQECLVLSMAKHQKYFALIDDNGRLSNKFLFVANLDSKDSQVVINGNQKVLSARLSDAKFFYDVDNKQTLGDFAQRLSHVVYHNKLGSQLDRVIRLQNIASSIAKILDYPDDIARHTAYLIKADLTTEMVGEFPELQGVMGKYYALQHGENNEVATAIEEHYYPRFSGDVLPSHKLAIIMALSDKLESLIGIWGIGLIPTGDKDPFALRRAALGIIRILLSINLDIKELLNITYATFVGLSLKENVVEDVYQFILQRLANYLVNNAEANYNQDSVNAALAIEPYSFMYLPTLIEKLDIFAHNVQNQSLLQANKRIENILRKNNLLDTALVVSPELLQLEAEKDLYKLILQQQSSIDLQISSQNWDQYFIILARFNICVSSFFDNVMVMDENINIKNNRIGLLQTLYKILNKICILSTLA